MNAATRRKIVAAWPLLLMLALIQLAFYANTAVVETIRGLALPHLVRQAVIGLIGTAIIASPFLILEKIYPGTDQPRRLWLAAQAWALYFAAAVLVGNLIYATMKNFGLSPLISGEVPQYLMAVALIGSLFVNDFFAYWTHRIQHKVPVLWRFHKVHHSIRDLNSFNCSHHVAEPIVQGIGVVVPMALLLKLQLTDIVLISAFIRAWGLYSHSDSKALMLPRLNGFLVDNAVHRLHHSTDPKHYDKNFASRFSFWDRVFGTYVKPDGIIESVGLVLEPQPRSALDFLLMPFRSTRQVGATPKSRQPRQLTSN